jgi:hypothetical protein
MPRPLRHDPARLIACPHCGEAVRRDARSCRHCGSDAGTGWGDHEDDAEVELPEAMDEGDHEEYVAGEPEVARHASGPSDAQLRRRRRALFAIVLALLLLAWGALARGQESPAQPPVDDVAAAAAKLAREELLALVKPLVEAKNYRVEFRSQNRRVRASDDPSQPPKENVRGAYSWTIDFEEGKPQRFTNGKDELWRSKTQFAFFNPVRKKWFAIARERGDISKLPRGDGEVAHMLEQAHELVLPHLLLADLATKIAAVEKRTEEGRTLWVATLTPAGVKAFGGDEAEELSEGQKGDAAKGEAARGEKPVREAAATGTLTFAVVDGALAEIASEVVRPVEKTHAKSEVTRSYTLSSIGTLALEVPAHITAVLRPE